MRLLTKLTLFTIFLLLAGHTQAQQPIMIPDILGFKTIQADFHTHTVFSDGLVWPTVRIHEAAREGIDAISITDHIEYRPFSNDVIGNHNRAYEIARPEADRRDVILIRGSEITRAMPPGHFNAIFLTDSEALVHDDWRESLAAASRQNAFIFWNHPSWRAQQPDTTLWWAEHTEVLERGWLHGIEVGNGNMLCEYSFQWCLDKNLTMIGTSDAHQPIQAEVDFANGGHRTMTLVFARERSPEGIREALDNQRTVVFINNKLVGREQFIRPLFENSIEVIDMERGSTQTSLYVANHSGLTFHIKSTVNDVVVLDEIQPHSRHRVTFPVPARGSDVNIEVTNLLIRPGQGLQYSFRID